MSLRIAHFIQRYPPALGGSEAYFARLSGYLAAHGDRVTVFTTTALALEAFWSRHGSSLEAGTSVAHGIEVRRYPLSWRWRGRRYLFKLLAQVPVRSWQNWLVGCNPISRAMWRDAGTIGQPFDVVHATALPYTGPIVCAQRLARRLGVPFFLTPFLHTGDPHDPRDPTRQANTRPAMRSLLRAADLVFAQTPSERAVLLDCGVAAERVVLQGMGVDPDECTGGERQRFRAGAGIGADEIVIGHLANQSAEKGSIDLLRAAGRLWRRGARFRVALAGPAMPNFERFWRTFPQPARADGGPALLRLGVLSEAQKRDFYAGIDVFALPSRSDSFGLVLLEAWANALPNLAYRAGGIADVVRDAEDGLLVRCGDIEALTTALARLAQDADLRARLGQAGRRRTEKEFIWADKLELVRQAYFYSAR
jgi:glycosyltransferase involved in cell wall biosynthesis